MRITVNNVGNIEEQIDGLVSSMKRELTTAMKEVTTGLQGTLRYDTLRGALGPKVSNAWRQRLYPENKNSADPTGLVYSKAANIIAAVSDGVIITAKKKKWLSIPLPTAGEQSSTRDSSGKFVRTRMTPERYEREHGVDLQFVSVHGGRYALLVLEGRLVKTNKYRRRLGSDYHQSGSITHRQFSAFAQYGGNVVAVPQRNTRTGAKARSGSTTIPIFLLVHSVMPPRLIDLEARADEAQNRLAAAAAVAIAVAAVPKFGKV